MQTLTLRKGHALYFPCKSANCVSKLRNQTVNTPDDLEITHETETEVTCICTRCNCANLAFVTLTSKDRLLDFKVTPKG